MYKLCCLDQSINDIYIGHTTDFKNRKRGHKNNCCNENLKEYNFKVYQTIREHGGWENWSMIQIEEYPCNNNREAEARETYWMKELKSTLNSRQSFTTKEEKNNQTKKYQKTEKGKLAIKKANTTEHHREYQKEYKQSEKYKQQQKEYQKEYRKIEHRIEYQKEYKQSEKYKQQQKKYKQTKSLYLNELKCYNF
jgi:hypothetical protein